MQKFCFLFLIVLIALPVFGFDRADIHQQRFSEYDIHHRDIILNSYETAQSISTSFSDLVVSTSESPAKFAQDNSSIAQLINGTWLIVFDDERNGSKKIYWQQYDSAGLKIGVNELVASSPIGSDFIEPLVQTDSSGNVYLFFRNSSEGLIYGSKYNPDLSIAVPTFLVNDTSGASFAGPLDIGVYPSGKFVVVWENYSIAGSTIECRLYNESAVSTFGPAIVNSDIGSASHWVPSVDVDPLGNYVVAWEDYRDNRADIYARLYNGSGTPIGSEFSIVPPPFNLSNQFSPEVCFTSDNNFVIGWVDQREGQEGYYQVYSALTGLVGSNQLISTADSLYINWNLELAKDTLNQISAVWASFGPQNFINLQPFTVSFTPLGNKIVINTSATGRRWKPSIRFNSSNEYSVVWSEYETDNADIHFNIFNDSHNSVIVSELKVNDDSIGAFSIKPQMATSTNWYNIIVFEDKRNDAGDIFIQTISNAGIKLNANLRVNQDNGQTRQSDPSIAASISQKKSIVTWLDNRDINAVSGQRIFARFGNEFGLMTDNEFLISDSTAIEIKKSPKVAINDNGKTLIVWLDKRSGINQIYGQWLGSDGLLIGSDFEISDPLIDSTIENLQVDIDNASNFYISYLEKQLSPRKLKVIQYLANGNIGTSFEKEFPIGGVLIEQVAASIKQNGDIVVVYATHDSYRRMYLAVYNSDGTEITAPFEILESSNTNAYDPNLDVSNNDYISVTWVDTRNGSKEIYHQIYDDLLSPVGSNTQVSLDTPEFMRSPQTTALNGRAWYCWADPRANGINVYANNLVYLPTDIEDNNQQLPTGYELVQNYPNPFNPTTEISFRLPQNSFVTISVYNMLGQHVKTLVESALSAGSHRTSWDATNQFNQQVASGIYFYKMESNDFVEMKKMMLLK